MSYSVSGIRICMDINIHILQETNCISNLSPNHTLQLTTYKTSVRESQLCGPHAVKVLATLFLLWVLSYAKTVQTVITVLSFTSRRLLDGSTRTVWLYDGNVEYLGVKHTFLFFTALLFNVGFLLPFTLLVLLVPCLQTWSNKRSLGGLTE